MIPEDLRTRVKAWILDDPDPVTSDALASLLAAGDHEALEVAFAAPLAFGTAGLRGPVGPGPAAMNRVVVRRAAGGLCAWLDEHGIDGPVVVGRDARHGSAAFLADTAAVVAGSGRPVVVIDGPAPTPLLAFAARRLRAAAAVMVTASHNPPADNGYKVYGPDAAQIVAPVDTEIAAHMAAITRTRALPLAGEVVVGVAEPPTPVHPLISRVGDVVVDGYLREVAALRSVADLPAVAVAYTPMHGVGADVLSRAFEAAGLAAVAAVPEQVDPDPDFPTVAFPNPEEPGAMDLVLALAGEIGADVALANDPDADRLAIAVPERAPDGSSAEGWRVLTGDEIGVLLADHLLRHGEGPDRLVVTTIVSSSMLASLAAAHGVRHVTTLTGFKWLAKARLAHPELTAVLGYEEALGYSVGDVVLDKDGISAAVVAVEVVGALAAAGSSVPRRLAELAVDHGLHRTRQRSLRFEGLDGPERMAAAVDAVRADPPTSMGGREVTEVVDLASPVPDATGDVLPPTDAVVLHAEGIRVIVRPSGTEPKLKLYVEVVAPVADVDLVTTVTAEADGVIDAVLDGLLSRLAGV